MFQIGGKRERRKEEKKKYKESGIMNEQEGLRESTQADQSRENWEVFVKKIGSFPKKLMVNIGTENTQIQTGAERVVGWCLLERN
jgi:hypothetical protein